MFIDHNNTATLRAVSKEREELGEFIGPHEAVEYSVLISA